MLYTVSQQQYTQTELQRYFDELSSDDAVILWGNGVYLLAKQPALFQHLNAPCYAIKADLEARGLLDLLSQKTNINAITMDDFVQLTERHSPQFAL
ncbi:hypothetical protein A4G18_05345 [Pasteurellaceae bacterium Pebbles2]|nr:hypothetical protein [Pasteurellaceae bacterium Pebbles2]